MEVKSKILALFTLVFLIAASCSTEEEIAPDNKPLGVSANSFLSDENFTSLEVEVVYVTGYEPTQTSISAVKTFLVKYLNKPGGITVKLRAIPAPDLGTYSLSEVKQIEDENRTSFTSGNKLSTFIFIADNKSDSSTSKNVVLGKAYKNTSMVIFQKEIRELAANTAKISSEEIQHTTIRHEFGHLFGLVNNGTPAQTPHEDPDPDNKAHCQVEGCLMAAMLDFGDSSLTLMQSPGSLDFDEYCHQDLVANGGK